MSLPRLVQPQKRYLITRRCVLRTFLLRPSALTNAIIKYCLAYAAKQTGMQVHAFVVMSNHWHLVVTDTEGRVSEFLRTAHQLVAKCINASLGRWESLWSSEAPSLVELADDGAVLDKMAYVTANPVTAGLVPSPKRWPGLVTTGLAQTYRVKRPTVFFKEDGDMPEELTLRCTIPDIYRGLPDKELALSLARRVAAKVREARASMRREERAFLGAKAVLRQAPSKRAHSEEVRRKLSPRVAAEHPRARMMALVRLKAFWRQYRDAWQDWAAGNRNARFPEGTYAMRLLHGAKCVPLRC